MSTPQPKGKSASPIREELLRHRPLIRKVLWYSLVINLLVLAPTLFMLEVYDRVVNSRNSTTLLMLLIAVIGAFVVMQMLDTVRSAIMNEVGMRLDACMRSRLFNAVFQEKLRRGGAGTGQPFTDLKTLREFAASPALMAMMDSPSSLIFLLLVFAISPWLGLMALIGALVQLVIAVRTETRTMPVLTEANRAAIEAQSYASSTLRNTQVIEAMGMLRHVHARWNKLQRRYLGLQAEASDHSGLNTATSKLIQMMLASLLLGAACWLALTGGIHGGGGMMIVASTLGARVLAPLTQLVAQWRTVVNARDAFNRLDPSLAALVDKPEAMSLPAPKGKLTVEGLIAGAPGVPAPIIRGITFAADPGEVVVVIGPSAAGKTSLARLLVGVWPAVQGKVRLDGADVFTWDKDELGPHVGYLPQNVELFDGSIADNIARFGDVDMDKVQHAAAMVGLHSLIESLPQGYDSRIGDDGAFLSGGQRQRVGLARAIYGNPRLIVLDEPNSSLDEAGDQTLVGMLGQLKATGATVVVISHRISVLPAADKLLVLRDGQSVAFGPRDEVMAAMQKAAQAQGRPPAGVPAVPATRPVAAMGGSK